MSRGEPTFPVDAEAGGGAALIGLGFVCLALGIQGYRESVPAAVAAAEADAVAAAEDIAPAPARTRIEPRPTPAVERRAELYFAFKSQRVDDERAAAALGPLIEALGARACRRLLVDGHSDMRGDDGINLQLSWRRAEAVRRWLTRRGIAADRIVVRSFGAYNPKISAAPDAEEQRRVEVRVLDCPS